MNINNRKKLFVGGSVAFVFVALLVARAFFVVHASGPEEGLNTVSSRSKVAHLNSQNFNALDPSLVSVYGRGIGGGNIEIAEGSVLIADIGLEGTGADLVEKRRSSDEISVYVVKDNDTLSEIAEMFGVSENTIVWANDLKKKTVSEGQELVILPITGVKHSVAKGDTLESIAKKYKSDLIEIAQYNGKDIDDELAVGDVVIVPEGTIEAPKPSGSGSSSSGRAYVSAGSGYFSRPVNGGRRTQGIHGNNGIDIAAPVGTPVYAAASGKVIVSKSGGWFGGYGNNVVIKHDNGTQTLYAHLSRNDVWAGEWVAKGQQIGAMGNTGRSTGSHLHFEVRGGHNPF